jgi:hypothetical protein
MILSLYLDEDAQRTAFLTALRKSNFDVVTVSEMGRVGYSDPEQLAWAAEQNRTIYTFNTRDFCQLHSEYLAAEKIHAGIIVVPRQGYSIGQQLQGIQNLATSITAETLANQLLFLSNYL